MERLVQSIPELKGEVITLNSWFSKKKREKEMEWKCKKMSQKHRYSLKYILFTFSKYKEMIV